ncbi:hypothetical protein BCL79_0625 [Stenotrophomonas rhizophila]|uniref:Uncharacterized protein n=1 Tax=Stenotrophomonas rhizophila TaxID=216778 RepID=A0A498CRP2_9GAMM|nr:hypothetical protein [Stenotrophomonas rhizophila]RLK56242.1 hypothetical protein BCL79_0625 [Stenotrophomonas rhizophila]
MTQHYVGTKIIEAWPAQKDGVDGYSVKYEDGYISWSPKDTFEAAYLPMGHVGHLPPHVQRMVAEQTELDDRIAKLNAFLTTERYAGLSEDERNDLVTQAKCMIAYWNVLLIRVYRARGEYERPESPAAA